MVCHAERIPASPQPLTGPCSSSARRIRRDRMRQRATRRDRHAWPPAPIRGQAFRCVWRPPPARAGAAPRRVQRAVLQGSPRSAFPVPDPLPRRPATTCGSASRKRPESRRSCPHAETTSPAASEAAAHPSHARRRAAVPRAAHDGLHDPRREIGGDRVANRFVGCPTAPPSRAAAAPAARDLDAFDERDGDAMQPVRAQPIVVCRHARVCVRTDERDVVEQQPSAPHELEICTKTSRRPASSATSLIDGTPGPRLTGLEPGPRGVLRTRRRRWRADAAAQ